MADFDDTSLPGIGRRHDLTLDSGERMAVVIRRDSDVRELLLYDPDDPDTCRATIRLSERDAEKLTELLQRDRRRGPGA